MQRSSWGLVAILYEMKARITQQSHNIFTITLQSAVEHAALHFYLVEENGEQHVEHFFSKSKPTSLSWWFRQFLILLRFFAKRHLKSDFIFAFSAVFGLGIVKNRFYFGFLRFLDERKLKTDFFHTLWHDLVVDILWIKNSATECHVF